MPDTGKWSSDQPGELVTMPTDAEVTEFIAAEQAEAEAKVERLAQMLHRLYGAPGDRWDKMSWARQCWLGDAREILEEIE